MGPLPEWDLLWPCLNCCRNFWVSHTPRPKTTPRLPTADRRSRCRVWRPSESIVWGLLHIYPLGFRFCCSSVAMHYARCGTVDHNGCTSSHQRRSRTWRPMKACASANRQPGTSQPLHLFPSQRQVLWKVWSSHVPSILALCS